MIDRRIADPQYASHLRFLEWLEHPGSVRFQVPGAWLFPEGALEFDFPLELNHRLDPAW